MKTQDAEQFLKLIGDVYAFYRQPFSDFAGDVWFEAMRPFELAAVSRALSRHCVNPDTGQFLPKPADVVKMLQGSSMDSALVAWSKVDKAVRSIGIWESVVFDDPIIHRVISEMGGWVQFGSKKEAEWPFVAREFENRYRGYLMRGEPVECLPKLIGLVEATNSLNGFSSDMPRLIGDPALAQKVYDGGKTSQETVQRISRPAGVVLSLIENKPAQGAA